MATLRARLIERIQKFGVEDRPLPGRDDGFSSLCYRGKAFAHLHSNSEWDIRLTKKLSVAKGWRIQQVRLSSRIGRKCRPGLSFGFIRRPTSIA
jgi:hypothetical protein